MVCRSMRTIADSPVLMQRIVIRWGRGKAEQNNTPSDQVKAGVALHVSHQVMVLIRLGNTVDAEPPGVSSLQN